MVRPAERLNALDTPTVDALHAALSATGDAKALLIAGQGRAFSAGFDLKQGEIDAGAQITKMQDLTRVLRRLPIPSVAVLHGHAVGGGLELALACDLVVAAPEAKLIFPDVGHNFAVGGGATYLLPRLIGLARSAPPAPPRRADERRGRLRRRPGGGASRRRARRGPRAGAQAGGDASGRPEDDPRTRSKRG